MNSIEPSLAFLMGKSPMELFIEGGPIMWPILFLSLVAVTVVIERVIFAVTEKISHNPKNVKALIDKIADGKLDEVAAIHGKSPDFLIRILSECVAANPAAREEVFGSTASKELARFHVGLPVLDTAITAAPLLGLLGTVTGMMASFGEISGEMGAPTAITGGIAEALIATAAGLLIAISSLLPYNYLTTMIEDSRRAVEELGHELEAAFIKGGYAGEAFSADEAVDAIEEPQLKPKHKPSHA